MIQLSWLIESNPKEFYRKRTFDYFIYLLEYQGEHSLLAYLQHSDQIPWKKKLEVECRMVSEDQVLLNVSMEMLNNHALAYKSILETIYYYFGKIRDEGP